MFRTAILSFAATAIVLAAAAPARAADAAPVQLLQPGDAQLSCDALTVQINQLAAAEAKPAKKKKSGFGGLGKLLGAAAPMLAGPLALPLMMKGGSGMGGALASQAMGMAQQGAMETAMSAQTDAAMAAVGGGQSIEAQRKARLMTFFTQKGC